MNQTLQERALLKQTQLIETLGEVLDFCESSDTLGHICSSSPEYWKKTLTRILGKTIVLQRGDLTTGEEWYSFAKLLDRGILYRYSLAEDVNGVDITPLPYYRVKNRRDGVNGIERHTLDIPALMPVLGSRGYFVSLDMSGYHNHRETNFFLHPDQTIALRNAGLSLGELYYDWHESFDLAGEDVLLEGVGHIVMPTSDFFVADIVAHSTEVGGDGRFTLRWEHSQSGDPFYTETSWLIRPITF